jgi:predicted amidophosphoribosyltransferase
VSACATCGCVLLDREGHCPACEQDAEAAKCLLYAGHLREVIIAFKRHPSGRQYIPALNRAAASLQSERGNHTYIARILRRGKGRTAKKAARGTGS